MDNQLKIKDCENKNKHLDFAGELKKKAVKRVGVGDTN